MRAFEYARAASLEGLDLNGRTRPLAGGTDLLTLMKADLVAPERLIDVKAVLPRGIAKAADAVTLGALTTLDEIETDAFVSQRYAALAQAAAAAATPQLREPRARAFRRQPLCRGPPLRPGASRWPGSPRCCGCPGRRSSMRASSWAGWRRFPGRGGGICAGRGCGPARSRPSAA